jgi:6-phosphofructokinase
LTSRAASRSSSGEAQRARPARHHHVNKNIGYELRCADPIPFDAAYCRDLGYAAIRFLLSGGSDAMVSVQGGRMVPIPFNELREPGTGRTRVRMVNVESNGYRVAREYMIRLEPEDFEDPAWVEKLARAGNMTADEFRDRFGYLTGHVPA